MKIFFSKLLLFAAGIVYFQACGTQKNVQTNNEQFIVGDALPDAPELALRGDYKVGVRTMDFINREQINVLKSKAGVDPLYDRPLRVEIWYPARVPAGKNEISAYQDFLGAANDSARPMIPFTFLGRAMRNADPDLNKSPFPLVIVSHGYLGSRLLLTYLTENLASKGYIVVAIDHTESTYADAGGFQSTLLNRSKDILFVLNQMEKAGRSTSKSFLDGLVDSDNTALIGYSMGGYGVLNVAGAGYSQKLAAFFTTITNGSKAIYGRTADNADFKASYDQRIKAVVAFAPWGMQRGVWDAEGLKGLKVPTFFVAGSQDDVSGYEDGIKAIYTGVINADRYLLTYENARHNVAPNPPPPESLKPGLPMAEYYHYAEPAWNERRINNINQHFITAFLGIYLKKRDFGKYLDVSEKSNSKAWKGFKPRSSVGLELLHATAAK